MVLWRWAGVIVVCVGGWGCSERDISFVAYPAINASATDGLVVSDPYPPAFAYLPTGTVAITATVTFPASPPTLTLEWGTDPLFRFPNTANLSISGSGSNFRTEIQVFNTSTIYYRVCDPDCVSTPPALGPIAFSVDGALASGQQFWALKSVWQFDQGSHWRTFAARDEVTLGFESTPYSSGMADTLAKATPFGCTTCISEVVTPEEHYFQMVSDSLSAGLRVDVLDNQRIKFKVPLRRILASGGGGDAGLLSLVGMFDTLNSEEEFGIGQEPFSEKFVEVINNFSLTLADSRDIEWGEWQDVEIVADAARQSVDVWVDDAWLSDQFAMASTTAPESVVLGLVTSGTVAGGISEVHFGGVEAYAPSVQGTYTTPTISSSDAPFGHNRWDQVFWDVVTTGSTDTVKGFVEYQTGGGWADVSNDELPGNADGFSAGVVDLSELWFSSYPSLRLRFELTGESTASYVALNHVEVTWTGPCAGLGVGDPCQDSAQCVSSGTCSEGGACVGNPCGVSPGSCNVCDVSTCTVSVIPDGAACDDGDPCSTSDMCVSGVCSGALMVCNDGNDCTDDTCVGGSCAYTPVANGAVCDDGKPCTPEETHTCSNGVCLGSDTGSGCFGPAGVLVDAVSREVPAGDDIHVTVQLAGDNGTSLEPTLGQETVCVGVTSFSGQPPSLLWANVALDPNPACAGLGDDVLSATTDAATGSLRLRFSQDLAGRLLFRAMHVPTGGEDSTSVDVVAASPHHPVFTGSTEYSSCDSATVRVELVDVYGNPVRASGAAINVTATGTAASAPITETTLGGAGALPAASVSGTLDGDGYAMLQATASRAGALTVEATYAGETGELILNFDAGVPSATGSSVATTATVEGDRQLILSLNNGCGQPVGDCSLVVYETDAGELTHLDANGVPIYADACIASLNLSRATCGQSALVRVFYDNVLFNETSVEPTADEQCSVIRTTTNSGCTGTPSSVWAALIACCMLLLSRRRR